MKSNSVLKLSDYMGLELRYKNDDKGSKTSFVNFMEDSYFGVAERLGIRKFGSQFHNFLRLAINSFTPSLPMVTVKHFLPLKINYWRSKMSIYAKKYSPTLLVVLPIFIKREGIFSRPKMNFGGPIYQFRKNTFAPLFFLREEIFGEPPLRLHSQYHHTNIPNKSEKISSVFLLDLSLPMYLCGRLRTSLVVVQSCWWTDSWTVGLNQIFFILWQIHFFPLYDACQELLEI